MFSIDSAKLLGTPKALGTGGAFLGKGGPVSKKYIVAPREKLLIENRPFDVAIAQGWRTAVPQKDFLRARRFRWIGFSQAEVISFTNGQLPSGVDPGTIIKFDG